MKGRFIIFEGLDCSGKTTIINELIKDIPNSLYCKGIGGSDWIGKLSRRIHTTFGFCFELIYRTYFEIIPNLIKGNIVLQDRYFYSVASYLPITNRSYNRFILRIARLLLIKPDSLIYLTLSKKERLKRLVEKGGYYELYLSKNQYLIDLRERYYSGIFEELSCNKLKIDTFKNDMKGCIFIIKNLIKMSYFHHHVEVKNRY